MASVLNVYMDIMVRVFRNSEEGPYYFYYLIHIVCYETKHLENLNFFNNHLSKTVRDTFDDLVSCHKYF